MMSKTSPFTLTVAGKAEILHSAEQAVLNISAASSGPNKATVSEDVISATKQVEAVLRELSAKNDTDEAQAAAPVVQWSKTSLTFTSHVPSFSLADTKSREYTAGVAFDVKFRDFKVMGRFGQHIQISIPHVKVNSLSWALTQATEKASRSQLRRDAARDAMLKAQDYVDALGGVDLRPYEVHEGDGAGIFRNERSDIVPMHLPRLPATPGIHIQHEMPGPEWREAKLEFTPRELKMSLEVCVRFMAVPASPSL